MAEKKKETKKKVSKKKKSFVEKTKDFFTKGQAKKLTLIMIIIIFSIGVLGSFEAIPLSMDDFTSFIESFGYIFDPLLISIGVGTAVKNHGKRKKKGEDEDVQEEITTNPR